jgi:hypothetical protein
MISAPAVSLVPSRHTQMALSNGSVAAGVPHCRLSGPMVTELIYVLVDSRWLGCMLSDMMVVGELSCYAGGVVLCYAICLLSYYCWPSDIILS